MESSGGNTNLVTFGVLAFSYELRWAGSPVAGDSFALQLQNKQILKMTEQTL